MSSVPQWETCSFQTMIQEPTKTHTKSTESSIPAASVTSFTHKLSITLPAGKLPFTTTARWSQTSWWPAARCERVSGCRHPHPLPSHHPLLSPRRPCRRHPWRRWLRRRRRRRWCLCGWSGCWCPSSWRTGGRGPRPPESEQTHLKRQWKNGLRSSITSVLSRSWRETKINKITVLLVMAASRLSRSRWKTINKITVIKAFCQVAKGQKTTTK